MVIHITAEESSDETAAFPDELPDLLVEARFYHIQKRGHHKRVRGEIILHADKVHGDIQVAERLVVLEDFVTVLQPDTGAGRISSSPPVVPVEDDGGLRIGSCAQRQGTDLFQLCTQSRHFAENAGILMACVVDHGAVVFLAGADAPFHLEKHNRIRTVGYRLITPQTHDARTLQGIIGMPVGHAGRLLHQCERLSLFEPAHQVMAHSRFFRARVVGRIVVP